jgi:ABC-type cobalamin/Fe3+-siderophores transport system ATPase subunit
MRGGKVIAAGPTGEVLTPDTVRRLYDVDADVYDVDADVHVNDETGHVMVIPVRRAGG